MHVLEKMDNFMWNDILKLGTFIVYLHEKSWKRTINISDYDLSSAFEMPWLG